MNKYIFLINILILSISSCSQKENNVEDVKLYSAFNKKAKINLSEIATDINYIRLQTDSTRHIGSFRKVDQSFKFYKNYIFINNSGSILRFDNSGKFINQIGELGEGPEEYKSAQDFCVLSDGNNEEVAIYSRYQQKTFFYTMEGKYLRFISNDSWAFTMSYLGGKLIYSTCLGDRNSSDYYTFIVVSPDDGQVVGHLLKKENEEKIEKNGTKLGASSQLGIYNQDGVYSFWESNYDTIWRIDEDFKMTPKYFLNIGNNRMPFEKQGEYNVIDFGEYSKYDRIERIVESSRYIFSRTIYNKYIHNIYFDKTTNKTGSTKFKKPYGTYDHFSFYNDIDGGVPFWPECKISDNKVFMLVDGYLLKDYIQRKGEEFDAISDQKREELLELANRYNSSENPILMIVTLKN